MREPKEKKTQGKNIRFFCLPLAFTLYVGCISSNHIRSIRGASDVGPKEKKKQGMNVLFPYT